MNTFLIILLVAAMLATVVALVRGVITFLQAAGAEARGDAPSALALKSNKMMQQRVIFQAAAVLIAALLMALAGSR